MQARTGAMPPRSAMLRSNIRRQNDPRVSRRTAPPHSRPQMDIPGHESVVEIPRRMVQFFLEVKKVDEDPDV